MKIPEGVNLTKFEGMEPAAARKMIAQDALLWLKLGKVSPTKGVYIGFEATTTKDDKIVYEEGRCRDLYELTPDDETFAHKLIEQIPEEASCKVCALGLATIAAVCRFNEVKAADLPANSVRNYLQKFFPIEQLYLMECAFEGWTTNSLFNPGTPPPERANARLNTFRWKYLGTHERLVAIFQNIVDNNGEFILPDVSTVSGYLDEDEDSNEGNNFCCSDSGTELCECESEDE